MPSYIIGHASVHDLDLYKKYLSGVMHTFKPFNGRILVAAEEFDVLEGEWPKGRNIVIEFPSRDDAIAWYKSDEYQKIAQYRIQGTKSNMIILDGLPRR